MSADDINHQCLEHLLRVQQLEFALVGWPSAATSGYVNSTQAKNRTGGSTPVYLTDGLSVVAEHAFDWIDLLQKSKYRRRVRLALDLAELEAEQE